MNARIAKEYVMEFARRHSGLEQDRKYLGMSQIGRCQAMLYRWMLNGKGAPTDHAHLNCISGYMHEREALKILCGAGVVDDEHGGLIGKELVAPFDSRFFGHVDAVARDGSLVEIKTFNDDDYKRITRSEPIAVPREYLWQVNAYMRYGDFRETMMMLVCRDPFTFWMVTLKRDDALGRQIEEKAKRILAAVDAGIAPRCECGRCDRSANSGFE